jgi:hypothetical protein
MTTKSWFYCGFKFLDKLFATYCIRSQRMTAQQQRPEKCRQQRTRANCFAFEYFHGDEIEETETPFSQ